MHNGCLVLAATLSLSITAWSQTADELVQKNTEAKGGIEKIKAIKTVRLTGKLDAGGGFTGAVGQENKRPNQVRETFTLQGMTQVQAYDGSAGWQIRPFGGRKDPQLMGEDDMRDLLIDADFDGPLVDYVEKGNKIEYLGHDTVDGDDALRLKVTLKNGDIISLEIPHNDSRMIARLHEVAEVYEQRATDHAMLITAWVPFDALHLFDRYATHLRRAKVS